VGIITHKGLTHISSNNSIRWGWEQEWE
jgi:hypothetical protein